MLALKLTRVSKRCPWTSTLTISVEHSLVTSFKTNLIPFKTIFSRFNQFNTPAAFLRIESIGLTAFSEICHTWLSHFYITFIGKRSPMTMLLTIMKRQCIILSLIGQFSFARNSLYMARSLIFSAQHNKTTCNVRSFALPKTIRVILGKLQEIERTQRVVYFQLRAISYTLGVMYTVGFKESSETKVARRFFQVLHAVDNSSQTETARHQAGESKRPITERTPNFREMERPIYHFLIEMVREEDRWCQFLELNR